MFSTTYEPNLGKSKKKDENLIDGIIYKLDEKAKKTKNIEQIEKLTDLEDVGFELAAVSGSSIDKPVIQNVSYSNWAGVHFADPIPAELAIPSDIRFREDLISLK